MKDTGEEITEGETELKLLKKTGVENFLDTH